MNSSMYDQIAKTTVADRLQAAEHARTLRAARPARQRRLPVSLRGLIVTRRVRTLARLRTA
ncbi:MAG: hypothetical protein WBF20_10915 [Trebonia sp.]|uniref:hypothetical protein n=1 Tax=Trebonia sp. TaxID=2767075 RepID=UPI003C7091EC